MTTHLMTADDFFTGLLAAFKLRGKNEWCLRNDKFEAAAAATFDLLEELAPKYDLDLDFRVRLHPIHGDSIVIRDAIYSAAQRDIVSLDNPIYQDLRLKMTAGDADYYLQQIDGGAELFSKLADKFVESYK